jgi:hypothetical protein
MAKIPLNYFTRKSTVVPAYANVNSLSSVYETPFDRASVIISALATNTSTTNTNTIYAALSTRGTPITTATEAITFVSNFPIAPNDTVNIVVNKLVLSQFDNIFVWGGDNNQNGDINLTLSVLETVNTK